VLVVLIGGLLLLPQLIPTDVYRNQIQTEATKALGRDVHMTGKLSLSAFPRIEARVGAATIANPKDFGGQAPFASMKELRAAVKLWPLLFGKVEIDQFVLVEPNIALVQKEDGANNWTFAFAEQKEPKKPGEIPSLGDVRIIDGKVSFEDRKAGSTHTLSDFDFRMRMPAIDKPMKVEASGQADNNPFKLNADVKNTKAMLAGSASDVSAKFETKIVNAEVKGTLALGDKPAFDFTFTGDVPSVPALADAFKVADLPARSVLGKVSAKGQALGTLDDITLKIADARHESPLLNANFNGDIRLAQAITLAITANAEAPKLADLAKAMNIEAPVAGAMGKATATTKVTGQLGDLKFSDVQFRHDSGLLNIAFDGSARLAADLTFDGHMAIKAPDLRQLAATAGAKLPEGDVYKTFAFSGDTSGGTKNVALKNAVVEFDAVRGTGEAALSMGGRPHLTGSLATNLIDVTPYALASGAPKDKKTSGGWGTEPLDLTPLRLADADLTLKAEGIKFQKFNFGPSNLAVTLASGKLTADLQQTSLFGGAGGAMVVADGSGAVPKVAVKASIKKLTLEPLMQAAAGFGMLDGSGDVDVDIAGSGASLQALMSSLAGNGAFKFGEGTLKGVDLPELAKGAQDALKTKSIPLNAFGGSKTTKFNSLNASFNMKNGVAAMSDLKLDAGVMSVSGGGSLDVGGQKLSLSLYPELKNKKEGVNGFGLPVKLAGGWDGVSLGIDYDWLLKRATSGVTTKVQDEIESQLKKQLGGDLGSLVGKKPTPATPEPASQPAPAPQPNAAPAPAPQAQPAAPAKPEDKAKKEINKALGKLLGKD
jgi:uncharacterized protein involved in outer membrane biogenesis